MEFIKMAEIYSVFAFLMTHAFSYGLSITLVPASSFDDAYMECTNQSTSSLLPRSILGRSNWTSIIKMMNVTESAWIGGERFITGCQNDSTTENSRVCTDIRVERLPGDTKLNYSCITGSNSVMVKLNSSSAEEYNEARNACISFTWSLPSHGIDVPNYKLPESLRSPNIGLHWYKSVDREYLKSTVDRECPMVTKTDECTLTLQYVDCKDIRRGICLSDQTVEYHDSLSFEEYPENNYTIETPYLTEETLCYEKQTTKREASSSSFSHATQVSTDGQNNSETADHVVTSESTVTTQNDSTSVQMKYSTSSRKETTAKTVVTKPPPPPPKSPKSEEKPSDSNTVLIVVVVFITLLVILIIVIIMIYRRRRDRRRQKSVDMEDVGDKRNSTSSRQRHSTNDVSSPLAGSMRKIKDKNGGLPGDEPGIEVLISDQFDELHGHDIVVKDLDEEVQETQFMDDNTIIAVSVESSDEKDVKDAKNIDTNKDDPKDSLNSVNESKEDECVQDKNENQTDKEKVAESTGNENEVKNDNETNNDVADGLAGKTGLIVDIEDT